jgi:hypothetical protein
MTQAQKDRAEFDRAMKEVILPGGAGAVSGALFDLPEWIAKQVNREGTEKWIEENEPAYRTGQMAGSVAGAFIPVGGLVGKGIQDLYNKYIPGTKKAAITGAILGTLTPLGLVGGTLGGVVYNFAKKNAPRAGTNDRHVIKYTVKPGTGLSVAEHSPYDEDEVLLHHGAKLKYSHTTEHPHEDYRGHKGITYVHHVTAEKSHLSLNDYGNYDHPEVEGKNIV